MKSLTQYIQEKITYRGGKSDIKFFDPDRIGKKNGISFGWGAYMFDRKSETMRYINNEGHIAHVEVPEDNGTNYLYYWKPLNAKQRKLIKKATLEEYDLEDEDVKDLDKILKAKSGMDFYKQFKEFFDDDLGKETSLFLDEIGIDGMIKSDDVGYCNTYIIYNPSKAKIIDSEKVKQ